MSRKIFIQEEQELTFRKQGFIVIRGLLSASELEGVKSYYKSVEREADVKALFYTSNWSKNYAYRKSTSAYLRGVLAPKAQTILHEYKPVYAHFMIKRTGKGSAYDLHQDWTIVDEEKYCGITFWCPLTDVDAYNGCMRMIPGSHRASGNIRGSNIYTQVSRPTEEYYTELPMKAGDALLFDQRIFHESGDNVSESTRVAAGIVMVPKESSLIHYHRDIRTDQVELYEAENDFLERFSVGDSIHDYNYKKVGEVPLSATQLTTEQLIARLKR